MAIKFLFHKVAIKRFFQMNTTESPSKNNTLPDSDLAQLEANLNSTDNLDHPDAAENVINIENLTTSEIKALKAKLDAKLAESGADIPSKEEQLAQAEAALASMDSAEAKSAWSRAKQVLGVAAAVGLVAGGLMVLLGSAGVGLAVVPGLTGGNLFMGATAASASQAIGAASTVKSMMVLGSIVTGGLGIRDLAKNASDWWQNRKRKKEAKNQIAQLKAEIAAPTTEEAPTARNGTNREASANQEKMKPFDISEQRPGTEIILKRQESKGDVSATIREENGVKCIQVGEDLYFINEQGGPNENKISTTGDTVFYKIVDGKIDTQYQSTIVEQITGVDIVNSNEKNREKIAENLNLYVNGMSEALSFLKDAVRDGDDPETIEIATNNINNNLQGYIATQIALNSISIKENHEEVLIKECKDLNEKLIAAGFDLSTLPPELLPQVQSDEKIANEGDFGEDNPEKVSIETDGNSESKREVFGKITQIYGDKDSNQIEIKTPEGQIIYVPTTYSSLLQFNNANAKIKEIFGDDKSIKFKLIDNKTGKVMIDFNSLSNFGETQIKTNMEVQKYLTETFGSEINSETEEIDNQPKEIKLEGRKDSWTYKIQSPDGRIFIIPDKFDNDQQFIDVKKALREAGVDIGLLSGINSGRGIPINIARQIKGYQATYNEKGEEHQSVIQETTADDDVTTEESLDMAAAEAPLRVSNAGEIENYSIKLFEKNGIVSPSAIKYQATDLAGHWINTDIPKIRQHNEQNLSNVNKNRDKQNQIDMQQYQENMALGKMFVDLPDEIKDLATEISESTEFISDIATPADSLSDQRSIDQFNLGAAVNEALNQLSKITKISLETAKSAIDSKLPGDTTSDESYISLEFGLEVMDITNAAVKNFVLNQAEKVLDRWNTEDGNNRGFDIQGLRNGGDDYYKNLNEVQKIELGKVMEIVLTGAIYSDLNQQYPPNLEEIKQQTPVN